MQGLDKYKDNGIHSYIFMISCGVIFGAILEAMYHEMVMFAASIIMGIYFALIHRINRALSDEPLFTRALISAIAITAVELAIGIITNRVMHLHLWNFSDSTFHLLGQICPRESLIRFLIAFPVIFLSKFADRIPIRSMNIGGTNG